MKPRKSDESDADYIARIEVANKALRESNAAHQKFHRYCVDVLRPTASHLGLLLDYAAEICDETQSEEYAYIKEELDRISGLPWDRDPKEFNFPKRLSWTVKKPEIPCDAEMILKSALEKLKCRDEFELTFDDSLFASLPPIEEWDFEKILHEIYDAMSDLGLSRALLRNDLRSAMYDYCIQRIRRAIREGAIMRPSEGRDFEVIPF